MNMIEVKNLKKSFGDLEVLKDVSFEVKKGEVIAALGPSGSGKSTLLRSLIELEKIDDGSIIIEGAFLCSDGKYPPEKKIAPIRSKMGMVFQHFNLFPHMSVRDNLICAPLMRKIAPKHELIKKCETLLDKVGLRDKIDAAPSSLSGGQKQRVAIARALMLNPDILLFDEPTSALDPELTKEVLNVIKQLAEDKMTMIIVTHEIGFAYEAADKILFMMDGYILDYDTPERVLKNSSNERINQFLNNVM